ncbi:inorganic phosphate transporter [Campylobacter cuniculorum]|uniref:Phosphate transporter n=2 Tax=Campylobacter cuniculorum TaxID=374106 RepID=A0A1W6BW52_9BACT|nr:inorganic phosphate transporter [Campylobacter cuniculorum]ARJ56287.1 inorganic phosphate transporter, PitA family [Campylobacter cuniculorum DSM 23162 = LMG 24588]QOR03777.1 inorganic phosphate transporter [Campylobacter cuniculorum]
MKKDNLLAFSIFTISTLAFMIWGFNYIPQYHLILFILASIFGIFMAFNIGGNDVANSFGTSVGAKTLTIKQALIIAALFELSGAIFAGGEVTKTIRSGIVNFPKDNLEPIFFVIIMISSLLSSGLWIFIATKKGLPVSTTHSIVGGIVGASVMMGFLNFGGGEALSMVKWGEILKIAVSWVISPVLGGVVAYIIYAYIDKKILKPSKILNKQVKDIKKDRKKFKEGYFSNLKAKPLEEQVKELSAIVLDDLDDKEKEESFYKNKLKEFREKEKNIDIFSVFRIHMPVLACIGAMAIAAMFLFKGLNNINTLGILQSLWIVAILGSIGYVTTFAIVKIVRKTELDKTADRLFSWFQIFTASSFAFSHGANDIANAVGPFAGILDTLRSNAINESSPVPFAVMAMFGVALVVGLWFLGKEVIGTVGSKLAEIRPTTGFSAELGASLVILVATWLGIPVSSTHILIGAVLGIGVYNRNANWQTMKPIGLAWIITLPAAGIMSALVFVIFDFAF